MSEILIRTFLAFRSRPRLPGTRPGLSAEYHSVVTGEERSMIAIRPAGERGHFDHGWLNTYHTFSFADYYDPSHMGFRSLRVINDDRVEPDTGFGTHGHRDMEILTYVLEGELEHRDSMGNGSIIRPGEVQRMTAGTGVMHSERNPSRDRLVHLLQIWILPERRGLAPAYEQKAFTDLDGGLRLVASQDGRLGSLSMHQDADLYAARLATGAGARHPFRPGRHGWLQIARGAVDLEGQRLAAGDGAAISDEAAVALRAVEDSEVLLFDLN
jgi:quercetin 2,3-dioxygenase